LAPSGELMIWADERAMKQALLNIVSNAIKFSSPGGRVIVRARVDESGRTVFEIEDNGIGMSAQDQERALQPFGQAQSATTRSYGGIGLGLPITEGLVEAHGGTLQIESRPGAGTLVRIILPEVRTRPAPTKPIALHG
jgi:signal transduction histidine kinase